MTARSLARTSRWTGLLFGLLLTAALPETAHAEVTESVKPMSRGPNNCLSITLAQADQKDLEKAWKDYVEDKLGGKSKKNKSTGEWFTDNAQFKEVGNNSVDIISTVTPVADGMMLNVWFDLGGAFMASGAHPAQFKLASGLLTRFELQHNRALAKEKLAAEEKSLEKENEKLSDMVKAKVALQRDIEGYKQRITEAEQEIGSNEQAQEKQRTAIEQQKSKVEEVRKRLESLKE